MNKTSRNTLLVIALGATTAHAAQDLEEVIVTADFRDSELMTSAASVSVLGELQIEERGAQHLEDVLGAAPNVSWSTGASRRQTSRIAIDHIATDHSPIGIDHIDPAAVADIASRESHRGDGSHIVGDHVVRDGRG